MRAHSTNRANLGWSLILLLSLLTALDAMSIDLYLPAFPAVAEAFAVEPGKIQQTLSIFLLGLAFGQGVYGPLLDSYGRRVPLLIGMVVFCLGSIMAALAPTIEVLMAARFIQALGAAGGLVAPRSVVADLCDVRESARIFSILMQIMAAAPVLAPLLGTYLLLMAGWRSVFWALAIVGLLGAFWALRALPETLPRQQRVPLRFRPVVKVYWQLCRQPAFFAYAIAGGFILGSLFSYITVAPYIFIEHFGLSPLMFSLLFAANAITLILSSQLTIQLLKRMSAQKILQYGLLLHIGAAFLLLLATGVLVMNVWVYFALLALAISGLALTFGTHAALTMEQAGEQRGAGSALMGLFQYLLGAGAGLLISVLPQGIVPLPLAFVVCGVAAVVLCAVAGHVKTPAATTAR